MSTARKLPDPANELAQDAFGGKTPRDAFVTLLARGFWPIAITPKGTIRPGRDPSEGKDPIGKSWGVERWTLEKANSTYKQYKGAGVGICLGPQRGPGGVWLIDVEGDGPDAEQSRLILFGGELIETLGWGSTRGGHRLLTVDPDRITDLLPRLKSWESRGQQAGVYKSDSLPGLELRIGGYKPNGEVKQLQSVVPPTPGTDGRPRAWTGPASIAPVPEAFYSTLERLAPAKPILPAKQPSEPIAVPRSNANDRDTRRINNYVTTALADEAAKVAGTVEGSRHDALRAASMNMAGLVTAGELPVENYRRVLSDAARDCGLPGGEAHDLIESALKVATPRDLTNVKIHRPEGKHRNGEIEGGFVGSVGSSSQEPPENSWVIPGSLRRELPLVHPLPHSIIPLALRGWLVDIALRGSFPIEYPATAALVSISSLLGRNLTIRPKRRDSWIVVPNLWGGIVGPPGLQKTPAVEEAFLPLKRLVAEAIDAHSAATLRAMEDAAIAEAKAGAAKQKLKVTAKGPNPSDEALRNLVREVAGTAENDVPTLKRYMINDATVEKAGELLKENPRGFLQFRDELNGFFRSFERSGHESDRGFYLETWTGNGSYTFDRIGRGTVHVEALCLSLFGTIQPGPLAKYLKGSASGDDADGFIPRFQMLVYPDAPAKFINVDQWPDKTAKNQAFDVFRWIDSLDPRQMGIEIDEDKGLPFLRFADDAQDLFDEWRCDLENRLRDGSESVLMQCHLAKYRSLMPSLALIFHVVDSVGSDRIGPVTKNAAELAAAWCEFLESHARRIYQYAVEGDIEDAIRLGEKITQAFRKEPAGLTNPFTFRQVANKGWSGLDTVEDVRRNAGILEDRGWVKVVAKPSGPIGGRPSEDVWVNPALLESEAKP
jgi:Protein of unknown function (DUF3987)